MILRRMADALRRQNWLTVFIEFAMVVLGVLIALQVANWNEARSEQARLSRYVDELQLDVAAEIEEMRRVQDIAAQRHAALSYLLGQAIDWRRPETIQRLGDDFILPEMPDIDIEVGPAILTEILRLETVDGQRHTFDALTSTGEFQLFNRHPVARELRGYYSNLVSFQDFEQDYLLPRYISVSNALHERGIARFGTVELDTLIGAVRDDAELASRLQEFTLLAEVQHYLLSQLIEEAETLEDRLEELR